MNKRHLSPALLAVSLMLCASRAVAEEDDDDHEAVRPGAAALRATAPWKRYVAECGACHLAYPPDLLPARSWSALLGGLGDHFGQHAELAAAPRKQIEDTDEVVEAELSRRATALIDELRLDDGRIEFDDDDDDLALRGLPFRVETMSGQLLHRSETWPATSVSGLGLASMTSPSGGRLRVLSVAFTPQRGREALVLRVAAPLAALSGLAERFRRGLLLSLLLAVVLSVCGATLLARWFLAPLLRVSRAVDALEARALTSRIDTAGLGPELSRLATAFNDLLARIALVLEGQRDFVGRASHALRTPLSSILAQAEVALRRERTPASYRETLQSIAAASRDTARLTEGLLALARADAVTSAAAPEEISLMELGGELERLFRPRAEVAGLRLEIAPPAGLRVLATRSRLREMLDALIDNALRYTPRGGSVRLTARAEGPAVVIEVIDDGPGVSPEDRARVFERFFSGAAATSSGQPGSGLGLAVVKALAEAEGAEISLSEAPGGGTRASLTFAPPPGN